MYFLVNASSPKLLDEAISNFAGAKVIFCFFLFVLLLYVPSQQLWSLRDGQLT